MTKSTSSTFSASSKRRILLTTALPYANSDIHIGHLVEHCQADFWTRFQKLQGHEAYFVCADDTHGTPVMIASRDKGITPETHIANVWKDHVRDFKGMNIHHDHYSSTNSETNRELCEYFYEKMKAKGHITTKPVEQLYCNHDKMFLPDRFVKGTCPKCGALDQYGDSCDKCGATYSTFELKNPYCSLCGNAPVKKSSEHILFKLNDFNDYLKSWLPKHTAREVANKMMEWFNEPLRDWDISRDEPYFGFKIPGYDNKFFYVWVDAPMGYISSSKEYFVKNKISFDDFWHKDAENKTEVYHLIGKDISYFHTLFWPALLNAADFRSPTQVLVHGHLTVNGEKMSKSKGTQLQAQMYLKHLPAQALRYYYASKMNSGLDDFDFDNQDFINRVNSELVGKITNLGSRGATMLKGKMDGFLSSELDSDGAKLLNRVQTQAAVIAEHYDHWDFAKAISEIRSLAEETNRYFDEKAPWKSLSVDPEATRQVLTSTLNIFRCLSIYLAPVLPDYSEKVAQLFNDSFTSWSDAEKVLLKKEINTYVHLANRIEAEKVTAMMEESKANANVVPEATKNKTASPAASADGTIEIDTFSQVDLRVAKIISAESIPEADKLLKLQVDLGPMGQRQIFAGIKSAYSPEQLTGRLTVIVANLKPRKMKFGMSEGMVLAAGSGGSSLFILSPDSGAQPGDKVK
jgi:methionyl-tRNA synthetase